MNCPERGVCKCEIEIDAIERLRATDEDVVDGNVDKLDDVANDTWHVSVIVLMSNMHDHVPMIRKPMPTACEMRMNSFLSGSVCMSVCCSSEDDEVDHTGAAVHEQSTLLEELSGHTAHMLAPGAHNAVAVRCRVLGKLLDVLHGD